MDPAHKRESFSCVLQSFSLTSWWKDRWKSHQAYEIPLFSLFYIIVPFMAQERPVAPVSPADQILLITTVENSSASNEQWLLTEICMCWSSSVWHAWKWFTINKDGMSDYFKFYIWPFPHERLLKAVYSRFLLTTFWQTLSFLKHNKHIYYCFVVYLPGVYWFSVNQKSYL